MHRNPHRVRPLIAAAALVTATVSALWAGPASAAAGESPGAGSHAYRHGAVPMLGVDPAGVTGGGHAAVPAAGANLTYGGAVDGIGVTTGHEKVYLVIYGSQWGTASSSGGTTTMSGDSVGELPALQQFFKGLGSSSDSWSGVMTQYCEGVAAGAQTCPASAAHVGYPTGGAYSGIWVDTGSSSPSQATGHQLGTVAVQAAAHFGNTTAASNRNSQYVILSPHGTHPDGFNTSGGQFCAWHDWNGDSSLSGGAVSSSYGDIAFTNMPYVSDAGSSCGQGFVNSPGTIDGVTIVEGHEYAETVTDQNPAGGWLDSGGQENGDKCAWIRSGQGASQNITLSTGSFPVQSTWANDYNSGSGGCEVSHPIVGGTTETVTVTNPGGQTGTVGTAASLQLKATDSAGSALTYSATGLPAGLSVNGSGLISGTPTTAGGYSVTATATSTTGVAGSTTFSWTISGGGSETVTVATPDDQTGTVGTAATLQLKATDSAGSALTYSATGLPAGLSVNSGTGLISGTPTAGGSSTVTVTATSATGASGSASFGWTITGGGAETVTVTNPGNQNGTVGTAVSVQISASDSAGKTLTFTATGLPAGLSISGGGLISGTPGAAATTTVTVTASSGTAAGTTSFTFTITGSTGGCGGLSPWNATTSYVPGDVVSYNGHKYTSTWYSTGATPGAPASWAVWQDDGAC